MASSSQNGVYTGPPPKRSTTEVTHLSLPIVKAVFATLERARTPLPVERGLNGSLVEMQLPDLLQTLQTLKKSGTLLLTRGALTAAIVLERGLIVDCRHPDPTVTIGATLIDLGLVTEERLNAAILCDAAAAEGARTLVAVLGELGFLTEEAAQAGMRQLIERTVAEVADWHVGHFAFQAENPSELGEGAAQNGFSPTEVLLTVLARADEARTRAAFSCSAPAVERPTSERLVVSAIPQHLTGKTVGIVCKAWLSAQLGAAWARLRGVPLRERLAIGVLLAALLALGVLLAWSGDDKAPLAENSCEPPPATSVSTGPAATPAKPRPAKPVAAKAATGKKSAAAPHAAAAKAKGVAAQTGSGRDHKKTKSPSDLAEK